MEMWTGELAIIGPLLARLHGQPPRELHLQVRPLRGGLEASGITQVSARYRDAAGRHHVLRFVVKRLEGPAAREASVYQRLVTPHAGELSPRLLAAEHSGDGRSVLYLEALRPVKSWPWGETGATQEVLERLARLHSATIGSTATAALAEWDYDAELRASAESTMELLEQCCRHLDLWMLGPSVRWTRRVVSALAAMRRQLVTYPPFGSGPIHGDVHPGNVLLRRRHGRNEPALLDWGRARIGSPLEDVSSWLQSVGWWEPEARRRHDTLLAGYLSARGNARRLAPDLREAYWLAGASNALSGALRWHLSVARSAHATPARRASAAYSARHLLRVLRRADACWR